MLIIASDPLLAFNRIIEPLASFEQVDVSVVIQSERRTARFAIESTLIRQYLHLSASDRAHRTLVTMLRGVTIEIDP